MSRKLIVKSGSSILNQDKSSYQKNYENSKKLLYSAMVLKARDRIFEIEQMAKPKADDAFWSQVEAILLRHEAQIDRATQQAIELRSCLSSSRKSTSTSHTERMEKSKKKLKLLQHKISEYNQKVELIKSQNFKNQEEKIKFEIDSSNSEIEQLNFRISDLRKSTNELKSQLQSKKAELESRSKKLVEKRKETEAKSAQINDSINTITLNIRKVEADLVELESREKICASVYESLKGPIPSIQNMFTSS